MSGWEYIVGIIMAAFGGVEIGLGTRNVFVGCAATTSLFLLVWMTFLICTASREGKS